MFQGEMRALIPPYHDRNNGYRLHGLEICSLGMARHFLSRRAGAGGSLQAKPSLIESPSTLVVCHTAEAFAQFKQAGLTLRTASSRLVNAAHANDGLVLHRLGLVV
jgi:hypothetical protein